jgi:alkylation response protein AidB-like acyl-CoA dehydrogenase
MDLGLTDDQELLRSATARFIEDRCPLERVRALADEGEAVDAGYLRQAAELGWFAMLVPDDLGGGSVSGRGLVDAAIVATERGRYLQPGTFVPTNVLAWLLADSGSEDQRTKVLPPILEGRSVAAWALADGAGDWTPGSAAQVLRRGSGVSLSGRAGLVHDAQVADWLLVTARSEQGLTQLLVAADTPGVTVVPLEGLDITRRLAAVDFVDVELDPSAVVGAFGGAASTVDRQLQIAMVLSLAESIGTMDQDFAVAVEYAKVRTAFGRPIGSFQAIKHLLADTSLVLEASKAVVAAAADAVQDQSPEAAEIASMAKAFVGDSGNELAHNCFQTFGGIGYTWEHDQHLYLRRLAVDAALYGNPSWHREHLCQIHGL